jgi:alkaline phosphatase
LQILLKEIEPLKKYLVTSKDADKPLTILISGERPPPAEYKNYPSCIFFDDDLKLHHTEEEWKRVGQVSLSFERYSAWKGENEIDKKDKKLLQHIVDTVHHAGKTIRFWAAPDNEASWKLQMKLGVDLIGTDQIDKLAIFLRNSKKN